MSRFFENKYVFFSKYMFCSLILIFVIEELVNVTFVHEKPSSVYVFRIRLRSILCFAFTYTPSQVTQLFKAEFFFLCQVITLSSCHQIVTYVFIYLSTNVSQTYSTTHALLPRGKIFIFRDSIISCHHHRSISSVGGFGREKIIDYE